MLDIKEVIVHHIPMKTKIIITVGPACLSREKLSQLIDAGVRIFRLNFSHGDSSSFEGIIRLLRELEEQYHVPLTILQDLSGPKIRIGTLSGNRPIEVSKGNMLLLGPAAQFMDELPYIPFDHAAVLSEIAPGDRLVIADGSMFLSVREQLANNVFRVEAENSGIITSHKGLALPGKNIAVPALTEKDKRDLIAGLALGVDAVALSYVQTPEDVREAKSIIRAHGYSVPVVAKLERRNAVDRVSAIIEEADIIMVARGDLGIECSLAELPAMQKRIVRACNRAAKPVIVATQMLVSMVSNPSPTRAETTDVANAVWDGADCVMLSEETAMGAYPVTAVNYMKEIATQAEAVMAEESTLKIPSFHDEVTGYLAYSACMLAEKVKAKGIVVHTVEGRSARLFASLKPKTSVYAVTCNPGVLHSLNFSWGIRPCQLSEEHEERHLARVERFINTTSRFAPGEFAIILAGSEQGSHSPLRSDLLKIYCK